MGQDRGFPGTRLQEYKPLLMNTQELTPQNSLPAQALLLADTPLSAAMALRLLRLDPQAADVPRPLPNRANRGCSDCKGSSGSALSELWHRG